ncbi:hypothetical protein SH668x_003133 [Planctomicrobium sp. SH668]|uniref:GHMP family kinase ATP-binding protein n=1 Tax=Planctomicrobium sp. SH668 TaxID=3448126 RepID=UPI003F5B4DCF
MMIEKPGVELTATSPIPRHKYGIASTRADSILARLLQQHPQLNRPVQIDLSEEIVAHSGLGSGTQLAMAMLESLMILNGESVEFPSLALGAARGDRSAIGLNGYETGGFLIDAGHSGDGSLGDLAARVEFPAEWRVVLLQPADAKGLHGSLEIQAFRQLGSMPESTTGRLCRLALTEILPALQLKQFSAFASALSEFGCHVGEFFGPTQGGVFASPLMRKLLQTFPNVEETGMAQSSWGPTIAMFSPSEAAAYELIRRLRVWLDGKACGIQVTTARNTGRTISVQHSH